MTPQQILGRAQYLPLVAATVYAIVLGLLTVPAVQREFIFLHRARVPFFSRYDNPEHYGLAPFKTRNVHIATPDGEILGAWHILPHSYYRSLSPFPPAGPLDDTTFDVAFTQRPTIIYFHGNAGTRAVRHRVRGYTALSTRLDCNVIALDYRGFGDSTGTPSEEGLLIDSRAAWDWVTGTIERMTGSKVAAADQVILVGQSLGTGVVSGLAGRLADEGVNPRALVLIAPFSSIPDLLSTPLKIIPHALEHFKSYLVHPFNSTSALAKSSSPTLLLHAIDDQIIPPTHSERLFGQLYTVQAGSSGPNLNPNPISEETYRGWGVIKSFRRYPSGNDVLWWTGDAGGHNNIGWAEGTIDLIARVAHL